MVMTALLRDGVPADADELLPLTLDFYRESGFRTSAEQLADHWHHLLRSPAAHTSVAAAPDGSLVAFAVTTTSYGLEKGLIAELEDLFVLPAYRRQRLGSALVDASHAWAHSVRAAHLEVVVAPQGKDVSGLVRWYAGLGFVDEGRRLLARSLST
jgi:aminoglycoside 6'-N-acetyltransferase I